MRSKAEFCEQQAFSFFVNQKKKEKRIEGIDEKIMPQKVKSLNYNFEQEYIIKNTITYLQNKL